jgi:biopolymer transport protein ExbD/biopolymer transport protein TolR
MAQAVRNEGQKVNSNINVTPMVDVMLVLLIIFMVITPMLQNKVVIDMVAVVNPVPMPDADKDDAIVVAITRDGGVFLGQNKVQPSSDCLDARGNPTPFCSLGTQVCKSRVDNPANKTIFVRADARAEYLAVENAIDAVRTPCLGADGTVIAGVEDVGLLMQKREGNAAGGS